MREALSLISGEKGRKTTWRSSPATSAGVSPPARSAARRASTARISLASRCGQAASIAFAIESLSGSAPRSLRNAEVSI